MNTSNSTDSLKVESIRNILKNVIKQLEGSVLFEKDDIVKTWNRLVSKRIKSHTKPTRLRDSNLIVNVDSSGWLFELQTKHKPKILKKMKEHLGKDKIKDIKFKIGETKDAT